ncbi:MAG: hypothetical protein IPK70_17540 [Flavobacteriales bacterium]|nr:hypothetical protein [Flavobacteriales bacterium]
MLLRVFLALLSASFASVLLAQGTVRGKVADKSGETLIGAAVVLKADPSKGTTTDLDGRYSLLIDAPGLMYWWFVMWATRTRRSR